ncbi:lambda family phage portal protein [Sedimentibacter acidaminivorans]|uniref:Lambda family phage portal protein n=1 Tax=Sedimentibacter acidaminivorans TaxID=913099 RepID=A0ABS4GGN2_9FIRM|nr:lambda family phage portal protein [Sedimentibacter acidaminivorans]
MIKIGIANKLENVINNISPTWGLNRAVARKKHNIINSGYSHHGASYSKKSLAGWISSGGSTKEDIDDNLSTLRERSRDLYMGAPIATGAIKTIRTNVVGSGLMLRPQIDYEILKMSDEEARAWERKAQREFALWADTPHCDAERMNNFYELQQLAFLSFLASGECFALLPVIKRPNIPYDLRVKLIEADRVSTPTFEYNNSKIINGVEIGLHGEVVAYYISNFHPLGTQTIKKEWKRTSKYGKKSGRPNVLHLMDAERPEQRRGVPILAPVIESLKQLARYSEAELTAAVISGMYTVFIESPNDVDTENSPFGQTNFEYDDDTNYDEIDDQDREIKLGNGAVVELGNGEKINVANPGRPNANFDGFVTSISRQIGSALELPYELLVKQFTASYSASRASLLEAWKMFRMRRTWLSNDFCQPIYEEWLTEAIAKGRINAPGFFNDPLVRKAYCGAEWNGPTQGQLDPLKEVNAAAKRVDNGFSTRTRETQELTGGDYNIYIKQRKEEEKQMKEVNDINANEPSKTANTK